MKYDTALRHLRLSRADLDSAQERVDVARARRDRVIREAYALEGHDKPSMAELAEAAGLSKAGVQKIVRGA